MPYPRAPEQSLPHVTEAQMREVDRAMIEDFGISLLQMMENAGRNLAEVARDVFLDGKPQQKTVLILAGPGGNGGGGLSAGRRLHNAGANVKVVLTAPRERLSAAAAAQLKTLLASGVIVGEHTAENRDKALPGADVILDAVLGYGLQGDPRPPADALIEAANRHGAPIVANDIPSGVEATSGRVGSPAIRAAATVTIALPKTGFRQPEARGLIGDLYLGDISAPPELYAACFPEFGEVRLFSESHILRVW